MTGDPETLPALLGVLGFSMSEFFNDDGTLKSHFELAHNGSREHRSLPYTLADYHYHVTELFRKMPPAERFAMFVQVLAEDPGVPEPIGPLRRIIWNFLLAIVSSINAGQIEEMCVNEPEPKDTSKSKEETQ